MDSVRLVQCAVSTCGLPFFLCSGCDHGQVYCKGCRRSATRATRRTSRRRYWRSFKGRRKTAARVGSLRHGTLVGDARELADAEPPRLIDHRALGSQAAEGGAAPAQVREVSGGLGVGLDGPRSCRKMCELNQRRSRATTRLGRSSEKPLLVLKTQSAYPARIVDFKEEVEVTQRAGVRFTPSTASLLSALRVVAEDDTSAPTVGFRVGDGGVEDRPVFRPRMKLRSGDELQSGVNREPVGGREPGCVVFECRALPRTLGVYDESGIALCGRNRRC